MPKFLQTARDKALVARDEGLVIVERERPFFSPGAMSMYFLALIAEAPVIVARYLLALMIVFAVLVIEGNLHGGTEWALVALLPTAWSMVALFNPTGGAWWWQTRAGGANPPNASSSPTKTPSSYSKPTRRSRCRCRRTGS
jgi:hypothetical protein